jgi:hypothetical protein
MIDFLRNLTPVWQFSAVILAFIGVVIAILNRTQRQRKALSYEIRYLAPLVRIEEAFEGAIKILLADKPVQNPHFVEVRILNSGNLPIIAADYERSVYLRFGENARILHASVYHKDPEDLPATVSIEDSNVVLTPILLNSGDSIRVAVLVDQFDELKVGGHIIGIKEIKDLSEEMRTRAIPIFRTWVALLIISIIPMTALTLLALSTELPKISESTLRQYMIPTVIAAFLFLALSIYVFVRYPASYWPWTGKIR